MEAPQDRTQAEVGKTFSSERRHGRVLGQVHIFRNSELTGEQYIGNGGFGQVVRRTWIKGKARLAVAEKQLVQYSTDG